MESIPMMICVARGGGGVEICAVSVLCGAGGGLTVQPEATVARALMAATARRDRPGTPIRVSVTGRRAR